MAGGAVSDAPEVLVVNVGSSSVKLRLLGADDTVLGERDLEAGDRGGRLVRGDQVELQARRAGVDDEDVAQNGQVQPATAGWSSPCSRVHARASWRAVVIAWRSPPALSARPGTRSITSITRW